MKLLLVGLCEPTEGMSFHPFHSQGIWLDKKKSGWVSGDSSMLMYDPFHPWEGPDSGHLLQASNCRIFGGAWPCPTRSEHLSCVSLNNGWKEMKWLGYSWVGPEYDRRETAFTQQPSIPSTCVRSEGWHAGLSSAWRDLNPQSPLPKRCPHADRSTSSGSGEGEKYPDGVALCSGYSPGKVGAVSCPKRFSCP